MILELDSHVVGSLIPLLVTVVILALAIWLVAILFPGRPSSSVSRVDEEQEQGPSSPPQPGNAQDSHFKKTSATEDERSVEVLRRSAQK